MGKKRLQLAVSAALLLSALLGGCGPKLPEKYGSYHFRDGKWMEMSSGDTWTPLERSPRILVHSPLIESGVLPNQLVQLKPVIASRRVVEEICASANTPPIRYTLNENNLSLTVNEGQQFVGDFYPVKGRKGMIELRFDKGLVPGAYLLVTNEVRCQCIVGASLPAQLPADVFQDTWYRTLDAGRASPTEDLWAAANRGLGGEQTYQGRRIVNKDYRPARALDDVRRTLAAQLEKDIAARRGDFGAIFDRVQSLQSLDPPTASKLQGMAAVWFDEAVAKAAETGDPADVLRYDAVSYRPGIGRQASQLLQEARAKAAAAADAVRKRNDQLKLAFEKVLGTNEDYGEQHGELNLVSGKDTKSVQLFENGIRWTEKVFFGSGKEKRWFGDFRSLYKIHRPGNSRPWAVRLDCSDKGDVTFEGSDRESRDRFFQQLQTACEGWHRKYADALDTSVVATYSYVGSTYVGAQHWRINPDPLDKNYFVRSDRPQSEEVLVTPDTQTISVSFESGLGFRSADRTPVKLLVQRLPFEFWNAAREKRSLQNEEEAAVKADDAYRKAQRAAKDAEWEKAVNLFANVIQMHPASADALNALAWLRATCPEARFRDGKQAVELALKACELLDWEDSFKVDTLAAAQAEAGDYAKAADFERRAIALYKKAQRRAQRSTDTPDYDKALARYLEGKPTRQKMD